MTTTDTYHHGALRAELLRRGLAALEHAGAEGISLRSLAEGAGVSKAAPYRHFADREAFLFALVDEGFRLLHDRLAAAAASGVAAMGRAYMSFGVERPALYRLMNSPLLCRMPTVGMSWATRALGLLSEALGRGGGPEQTAAAWAYVHGVVLLRIDRLFPMSLSNAAWERLAGAVDGVAPRVPSAPGGKAARGAAAPRKATGSAQRRE